MSIDRKAFVSAIGSIAVCVSRYLIPPNGWSDPGASPGPRTSRSRLTWRGINVVEDAIHRLLDDLVRRVGLSVDGVESAQLGRITRTVFPPPASGHRRTA
jgi:hypothetical protein